MSPGGIFFNSARGNVVLLMHEPPGEKGHETEEAGIMTDESIYPALRMHAIMAGIVEQSEIVEIKYGKYYLRSKVSGKST